MHRSVKIAVTHQLIPTIARSDDEWQLTTLGITNAIAFSRFQGHPAHISISSGRELTSQGILLESFLEWRAQFYLLHHDAELIHYL